MALRPALRRMYVGRRKTSPAYWPGGREARLPALDRTARPPGRREYAASSWTSGPVRSTAGWRAGRARARRDDELQLDEGARELAVQGELVSLTPLELGLFRHLREPKAASSPAASCCARSGAPSSPAAATSSTPSCGRCASKLGTAGPSWRPCAAAATACARTGALTSASGLMQASRRSHRAEPRRAYGRRQPSRPPSAGDRAT